MSNIEVQKTNEKAALSVIPFPLGEPLFPSLDPVIRVTTRSGLKQGVADLPEDHFLVLNDKPKIIKNVTMTDDGLQGEQVSLDDFLKKFDLYPFDETLQKILNRVPELSEIEKSTVYSSADVFPDEEVIPYYFGLLDKFNIETYIRDFK